MLLGFCLMVNVLDDCGVGGELKIQRDLCQWVKRKTIIAMLIFDPKS